MQKLVIMSVFAVPIVVALLLSRDSNPRRGMQRTVVFVALWFILWSFVSTRLYLMFPPPPDPPQ
jgi:hypothetical protein